MLGTGVARGSSSPDTPGAFRPDSARRVPSGLCLGAEADMRAE